MFENRSILLANKRIDYVVLMVGVSLNVGSKEPVGKVSMVSMSDFGSALTVMAR